MATRKYDKTKLDLQYKKSNEMLEFFISDTETCDFYIRLTRANMPIKLDNIIVVLCAIDPSNQVRSQFINTDTNKEGIAYCKLENTMKSQIGTYQAKVMLVYEDEKIVTDTFNYTIKNDMFVALNREIVADERFQTLNDMLGEISKTKSQEDGRVIAENGRVIAENGRVESIESIKNQISQLISDSNTKVNVNITENTNKTDTLISSTTTNITEMLNLNTTKIDELVTKGNTTLDEVVLTSNKLVADIEKYKTDSSNAIELYKVTKDGEINQSISDYKTATTDSLNLLFDTEVLKLYDEMINNTDTFKATINSQFTKLDTDLKLNVSNFVTSKESYIDTHLQAKSLELTKYISDKNIELNTYVNGKTVELNDFVGIKTSEVNNFITTKNNELDTYKTTKNTEINKYFNDKEVDFNSSEKVRTSNENRRENNEYARGMNENNRKSAEDKRNNEFNAMKLSFSQMLKFNANGELEVTIDGVTKVFVPK